MSDLPSPAPDQTATLAAACGEAERMLRFAVRSERLAPAGLIEATVRAIEAVRQPAATADDRVAFWNAFNALSSFIAPATAESLRCVEHDRMQGWRRRPSSPVTRAIDNARRLTLLFLGMLVITQIVWLFGSTSLKTLERLEGEVSTVQADIDRLILTSGSNPSGGPATPALIETQKARRDVLQRRVRATLDHLHSWNLIWQTLAAPARLLTALLPEQSVPAPAPAPSLSQDLADAQAVQLARLLQQSVGLYLLPLLYGMLGACTAILRRLNDQVRTVTFTEKTINGNRVRLTLGTVAGPTIGLFFSPEDNVNLLAQLSPFAIAFVAGYSIDVLFTALDRLIQRLKDAVRAKDDEGELRRPATKPSTAGPDGSVVTSP
jgi:hypothetical protein